MNNESGVGLCEYYSIGLKSFLSPTNEALNYECSSYRLWGKTTSLTDEGAY